MRVEYYTVARLNKDIIHSLLPKLPSDIDLVVGIPRDGIMVATLISQYRNIPMTDLDSFLKGGIYTPGIKHRKEAGYYKEVRRTLLVDDICGAGTAMKEAVVKIKASEFNTDLLTAVVYRHPHPAHNKYIDIAGIEFAEGEFRHYEWTVGDAIRLPHTAFDIDGVLCSDCEKGQDDDGSKYVDFLVNAPLKIRPQNIGYLITCRTEKYRDITMAWLRKNGITYKELIMRPSRSVDPVTFKSREYAKCDATLLIESSAWLAKRIADKTGKTVVGIDTNEVFHGDGGEV